MANFVREIMNPELFTVTADARTKDVLDALLEYGITAAPVVDDARRPIGVTSLRDVLHDDGSKPARSSSSHISSPAITVGVDASVDDAARIMAETGRHHLVVVGADGRVVGLVSSLDLLRALVGFPIQHPRAFPHLDSTLGVAIVWSDPLPIAPEHQGAVPCTGGVLVLSQGGAKKVEHDVWAEDCNVLRTRVTELLNVPQDDMDARLKRLLFASKKGTTLNRSNDEMGEPIALRFRFAEIADPQQRRSIARRIRARIDAMPLPFGHMLVPDRKPRAGAT